VTGVFAMPYGGQCLNVGRLSISQKRVRAPTFQIAFPGERQPLVRTSFANLVPKGRLNLAQDASPGLDLKGRPVPEGRLEIGRDAILLQPSLRDKLDFQLAN
jgi:hypothetical protein